MIYLQATCFVIILKSVRLLTAAVVQISTVTYTTTTTTIDCPITQALTLPTWSGPPGDTAYTERNYPYIYHKADRLAYASNRRSLILNDTQIADAGTYKCIKTIDGVIEEGWNIMTIRIRTDGPEISDTITVKGRKSIRGTEGVSQTLACISTGGYPAPTVVWYRGTTELTRSSSGSLNGTTYTVVLSHRITPTRTDDRQSFMCQSYYPSSEVGSQDLKTNTAELYLNLKPDTPKVILAESLVENKSKQSIATCVVTGFRPSSSINVSWIFHGNETLSTETPTEDLTSETYNITTNFEVTLTRQDHGHLLTCQVKHQTLANKLIKTVMISNVLFRPLTVTITGNSNIIADGSNTLTLTCSSGTSNPISDITWRVNNTVILSTVSLAGENGDYGGKIRRKNLTLKPTRYDDGHLIYCIASNAVTIGTNSPATHNVALDLRYSPNIDTMPDVTAVEGTPNVSLTCKAHSKPSSAFRWYRGGSILDQYIGTSTNNQLVYTISIVNRSHAGTYRCNAGNNIGSPDTKNVQLVVQYPPYVAAGATNTTVKQLYVDVICTAAGIPNYNYKYKPWIQSWPGYGEVTQWSQTPNLTLTNLTYAHSGIYRCSASNGVKVYGTNTEYMDGTVNILVKSFPVITSPVIESGEKHTVPAELNTNTTAELTYYVNTDVNLKVSCHRNINKSRQPNEVGVIEKANVQVVLPVFSHTILTQGTKVTLTIEITNEGDFGAYDIVITNEIGTTVLPIEITPIESANPESDRLSSGVIGGIAGSCVAVVVLFIVVVILVRKYKLKINCDFNMENVNPVDPSTVPDAEKDKAETKGNNSDPVSYYNTAASNESTSQYTSLKYSPVTDPYDSLQHIELHELQPSKDIYQNLKI